MLQNSCQQCQHQQDELELSPTSLAGSLLLAGRFDVDSFQITSLVLGPEAYYFVCPLKCGVCISHNLLAFLKISTTDI